MQKDFPPLTRDGNLPGFQRRASGPGRCCTEAESSSSGDEYETNSEPRDQAPTHSSPRDRAPIFSNAMTELRQMMSEFLVSFSQQMDRLNKRMDSLEQDQRPLLTSHTSARGHDSKTSRASPYQPPRLWVDRPQDEPLPQGPITWPDKEDDESALDGGDLTEVAEGDDMEGCTLHKV